MSSPQPSSQRQLVNATAIVALLLFVSRILGFVRRAVFGNYFGAMTLEAEAYAMVMPVADFVFQVIAGGAVGSAFIPTFARILAQDSAESLRWEQAWRLFSNVLNLIVIMTTAAAFLVMLFAHPLLLWLYPARLASDPLLAEMSRYLLQVTMLSTIIFSASGVVMAALNARHAFVMPTLAAVIYNLGIIAGIILWQPSVYGVAYGAVIGALGHLLVQLPALHRLGVQYRPKLALYDGDLRGVLRLIAPRVLGVAFSYLNPVLSPIVAQTLPLGSQSALSYALSMMLMPQGMIGQSLGIVAFPTFASLVAKGDRLGVERILSQALRLIFFLGLPITAFLMVLAHPLIALAFQRGQFSAEDTALTANALLFYALALVALSLIELLARAFYAYHDTTTPVVVGALQLITMFFLSLWFGRYLFPQLGLKGVGGVALGFALANWLEVLILLWLFQRRHGGVNSADILDGSLRSLLASCGMAIILWIGLQLAPTNLPLLWQLLLFCALSLSGALTYLVCAHFLRLRELTYLQNRIWHRR